MRFGIEYFHYDHSNHETLYINRAAHALTSSSGGTQSYSGANATSITVMEISG